LGLFLFASLRCYTTPMKIIPKTKKDFEWVNWGPKDIDREARRYIEKIKSDREKIKTIPKKDRTFENTIYALEKSGDMGYENSGVGFLKYVSTKKIVREASHKASIWMSQQMADITNDIDLYYAFKEYNPIKEKLSDEEKVLYKDIKIWFEGKGFHLDAEKRKDLVKINKKLSKLGSSFSKNISDHEDSILCSKEELSGLPKNYIANLKKDKKTNKFIVSLDYPEVGPFMSFADSDKKRKELAIKNGKKGGKRNLKILQEILLLRKEKSEILGFESYSEMVVKHRMSKKPETIKKFLESTIDKLKPEVIKDTKKVKSFAKKELGIKDLTFYNSSYVGNKYRKHLFDYDPNITKEYFQMDKVMDYMFSLFGKLFDISFKKNDLKLWDKDVLSFDVFRGGTKFSHIILDLYPRKGKYGHMACWGLMPGEIDGFRGKNYKAPLSVIVGNFPKGTKKNPSLLSIGEIETLFHEFGHMCHNILSKASFDSHSGTNTDFDFVETPSQLFENWVKDINILTEMSCHYKTGKKLPKDIQDKIVSLDGFMKAGEYYGAFVGGIHDLLMHTDLYKKDLSKAAVFVHKKYGNPVIKRNDKTLFPAGWGHMVGYASSYYTYMWSLVYAYDIFSRFKKEGIKSKKVGKELRENILSKGGSVDEMSQMKDFLGRKPNNKAFLGALGIK
jgi:thimet oligopeptidase